MTMRVASMVGAMLLIGLWVGGGVPSAAAPALPALTIDSPADHGRVNNPVLLLFETPADLSQLLAGSSGGGSSDPSQPTIYLHISWDSTVVMPTADQITQVGQTEYQFNLPRLAPGMHQLKVFWADSKTHRPIGNVQSITINVAGA